jgi:hypothetical protein
MKKFIKKISKVNFAELSIFIFIMYLFSLAFVNGAFSSNNPYLIYAPKIIIYFIVIIDVAFVIEIMKSIFREK